MKPNQIKSMARNILSDGKVKDIDKDDTDVPSMDGESDDLGAAESVNVERAGHGYIVHAHHPARQAYREHSGAMPDTGTTSTTEKRVFTDHESMMGHVRHKMRPTAGEAGAAKKMPLS